MDSRAAAGDLGDARESGDVLLDLLTWMSPAWPIGAFAHSGGLEWAVEAGLVTTRASTADWIAALLDHGALHNDAVVFVHAWRAGRAGDGARLRDVAELAAAAQTGFERRLETTAQGAAFRRIAIDSANPPRPAGEGDHAQHGGGVSATERDGTWHTPPPQRSAMRSPAPSELGEDYAAMLADIPDADLTYPIAAATLFACREIALEQGLTAFLHGAIANLVSAAQRLVPLGQTDAQRILRDLRGAILAAVARAVALTDGDPFDAFAGAALMAELGCMAHETQYTRLFRT